MMDLVPRNTIEEVVRRRDHALELYEAALEKIEAASEAVALANREVNSACAVHGEGSRGFTEAHHEEITRFNDAVTMPDPAVYKRVARRIIDLRVWSALIEQTDLESLMDREAKEALAKQMAYVPDEGRGRDLIDEEEAGNGLPPVTVDAVYDAPLMVLEPSAGDGAISLAAVREGATVDVVEIEQSRAAELDAAGIYRRVIAQDFLKVKPEPIYDRVLMNPPFDKGRDVDHVAHAWRFLKPGGILVAVVSAGTEFREDKKTTALREMLGLNSRRSWMDLPAGSFAPATFVNATVIAVTKEEA